MGKDINEADREGEKTGVTQHRAEGSEAERNWSGLCSCLKYRSGLRSALRNSRVLRNILWNRSGLRSIFINRSGLWWQLTRSDYWRQLTRSGYGGSD